MQNLSPFKKTHQKLKFSLFFYFLYFEHAFLDNTLCLNPLKDLNIRLI